MMDREPQAQSNQASDHALKPQVKINLSFRSVPCPGHFVTVTERYLTHRAHERRPGLAPRAINPWDVNVHQKCPRAERRPLLFSLGSPGFPASFLPPSSPWQSPGSPACNPPISPLCTSILTQAFPARPPSFPHTRCAKCLLLVTTAAKMGTRFPSSLSSPLSVSSLPLSHSSLFHICNDKSQPGLTHLKPDHSQVALGSNPTSSHPSGRPQASSISLGLLSKLR
jgi:hypothetical protein